MIIKNNGSIKPMSITFLYNNNEDADETLLTHDFSDETLLTYDFDIDFGGIEATLTGMKKNCNNFEMN